MKYFFFFLPLILLGAVASKSLHATTLPPATNLRPIIGVLTVPLAGGCVTFRGKGFTSFDSSPTSCFHSLYVKWIESSGARVVPIRYDSTDAELLRLVSSVNGILFTGGDTPIIHTDSQYMHAAGFLLNHTVNSKDHFPLWGTCMGIQTLSILVSEDSSVLESGIFTGVDPQMMPLNVTDDAKTFSRLLNEKTTPTNVMNSLLHSKVTTNLHHDGVNPKTFMTNEKLKDFFYVLSTNVDTSNHPFVSTIEAKNHPIYGVQWHPERPQFDWSYNGQLNHDMEAIYTMQYFSNYFINEARRNHRSFDTIKDETEALIYNYNPIASGYSYQAYLFEKI